MRDRLKRIREHFGLSQREFAERMSVKHYLVNDCERGKQKISAELAAEVVKCFGVSADFLLLGRGEMFPTQFSEAEPNKALYGQGIEGQLDAALEQLSADEKRVIFSNTQELLQFKIWRESIEHEVRALRQEVAQLRAVSREGV